MNAQNTAPAFENPAALITACAAKGGALRGQFPAEAGRRVLLASHELGLNGAPIVLLYMARSLRRLGWQPVLISPAEGPLLDTLLQESFPVLICPSLLENDVLPRSAGLFRFVALNTIVFAQAAAMLNGAGISVLWWVHEAEEIYHSNYVQCMPPYLFSNIRVYADSPRSREHLLRHNPGYFAGVLTFGIPNIAGKDTESFPLSAKAKGKRIFALMGTVERRKGQDVLLDAVKLLPEDAARQCFFVFVGPVFHIDIGDRVRKAASDHADRFQYIPQLPLEKLHAFYSSVDCVVCASRDDPGPITVVEGCQFSKAVICSEHTGMAPLLEQDRVGFVYGGGDPAELAQCIVQVLDQSAGDAAAMGERARSFYLSRFSSAAFDRRMETEILPELLGPAMLIGKPDAQAHLIRLAENSRQRLQQLELQQKKELERMISGGKIIREKQARITELEEQNRQLQERIDTISNAFFWKSTKAVRFTLDVLKQSIRPHSDRHLLRKGLYSLRTNGVRVTWQKTMDKICFGKRYLLLAKQALFTEQELSEQREHRFPRKIKFSIAVPLYNTPEKYLRAMIESVLAQTYADWELCMADGSDAQHGEVERVCREYADGDRRVRYRRLEKNLGISGNSNACLEMATGDYIGLFDHDDLLHPAALYEVMRAICEKDADFIYTDENTFRDTPKDAYLPHFKPDFAPDSLRANNYICHFTVFKRSLLDVVGLFDPACDGAQDHDMVLRLTEKAQRIAHIPEILYYWRAHKGSVAESVGDKPYVIQAGVRAVGKQLERLGLEGTVEPVRPGLTIYRTRYKISGTPRVSILIPNYEHLDDLKKCLNSIFSKTTWPNYEVVIVENNSISPELFAYYSKIQMERDNVRVVTWQGEFNYSAINNFGARRCTGDYLLLLNNDTEVITPGWIEEMLMFAQREDVGAVGAMLYYPGDTIQHAGVGLEIGGVAANFFTGVRRGHAGYSGRLLYAQNLSAVTAACMLLRREVWDTVGGLDENWAVAFNDVDLCMRIRQAGFLIVWTPFAELYHHESKSRGCEDTPEKQKRFQTEVIRFQQRWKKELAAGDPYYNPNLTLDREDFSAKPRLQQYDAR